MAKKLVLLLVGILLCNLFVVTNGSASGPLDKIKEKFEFKSELILTVDEEFTEHELLVMPGARENITVNVKYRLDIKPITSKIFIDTKIGNFLFFKEFGIDPEMKIDIKARAANSWNCSVIGGEKTVKLDMSNEFAEASVDFKIYVEPNAKAFQKTDILFTASNRPGKLNIQSVEAEAKAEVIYGGDVDISVSYIHLDVVKPMEESTVPVTIQNWGDVETIVDVELEKNPETWDIDFVSSSFTLKPGGKKTINVKLKTKSLDSNDENVKIKFSPRASVDLGFDHESFVGEEKYCNIQLMGSNMSSVEKSSDSIPGFEIILISVAIITIIAVIICIKRKNRFNF